MIGLYSRFRGGLTWIHVAVTLVVLLGVSGLAVAAVPGSRGVIHGCYGKQRGTVRVIHGAKCSKSEKAISWNKKGRRGPRGVPGTPGATGLRGAPGQSGGQGPVGPSDGYFTSNDGQTALSLNFGAGGTSVAHLDVPAGSYLISAKADLGHSVGADAISEGCILKAGSDTNRDDIFLPGGSSSEDDVVVPYQTAHTFTSADGIDLSCYLIGANGGDSGFAQHVRLSALRVGALHVQ